MKRRTFIKATAALPLLPYTASRYFSDTFGDFWYWLAPKYYTYQEHSNHALDFKPMVELTREDVMKFVDGDSYRHQIVKVYFEWVKNQGYIPKNPLGELGEIRIAFLHDLWEKRMREGVSTLVRFHYPNNTIYYDALPDPYVRDIFVNASYDFAYEQFSIVLRLKESQWRERNMHAFLWLDFDCRLYDLEGVSFESIRFNGTHSSLAADINVYPEESHIDGVSFLEVINEA